MVDGMPEQIMTGSQERTPIEGNVIKTKKRGTRAEEKDRNKEISLGVEVSCLGMMGIEGGTRTERK